MARPKKDKLSSSSMSDSSLLRLCHYMTGLVCVMYDSPYIREEVFDVALVTAHLARAKGISKSLLVLTVKHRAKNELYRLIGYRNKENKEKSKLRGEPRYGFKLDTLVAEGLTIPGKVEGSEIDNPSLPQQASPYERLDNSDLLDYLLSRLDERSRSFVKLFYLDGYSSNEIAGMYGIGNPGMVQKVISRSVKRLKELPEFEGVAL